LTWGRAKRMLRESGGTEVRGDSVMRSLMRWCVPEGALRFRGPITGAAPLMSGPSVSLAAVREGDELAQLQRRLHVVAGASARDERFAI